MNLYKIDAETLEEFSDDPENPDEWLEGDDPKLRMLVNGLSVARDPENNLHVLSWDMDGVARRWAVVESDTPVGKGPLTEVQFLRYCRIAKGIHTDG
jgi:hypothetical protein